MDMVDVEGIEEGSVADIVVIMAASLVVAGHWLSDVSLGGVLRKQDCNERKVIKY